MGMREVILSRFVVIILLIAQANLKGTKLRLFHHLTVVSFPERCENSPNFSFTDELSKGRPTAFTAFSPPPSCLNHFATFSAVANSAARLRFTPALRMGVSGLREAPGRSGLNWTDTRMREH